METQTQLYLPNDGQEFQREHGITKHNFTHEMNTEYVHRTAERKQKYIYRMTVGILKTNRHETYYRTVLFTE